MIQQPEALRLADRLEDTESARLHLLPYAAAELRRLHAVESKYNELLFAVGSKRLGETRHDTALRYIKQAEDNITYGPEAGAKDEREACAKVCEARYMGDNNREDMEARRCAAAIRAQAADRLARHGIQIPEDEEYGNPSFG
jgi:hypothetical protein